MEKIFNDFLSQTQIVITFSILSYIFGYIIKIFVIDKQSESNQSKLSEFTETITLGFFAVVFVTALIATRGNTSFWAPIAVLIFWGLRANSFALKLKTKPFLIKQLIYFCITFLLFSIGMAYLLNFDNRLLIHNDISFYARLSHNMAEFNIEGLILDPIIVSEYPANIYHFFNEWLTVFAIKISNLSALKVFILFTLPCLTVFLYFNLMSVTESLLKNNGKFVKVLVPLLVLAMPGLLSLLYHLTIKGGLNTSYSVLQGGILFLKMKVVFLLMIVSLKYHLKRYNQLSLIILSLIPIFWNSVIPAFVGGAILFLIFKLLYKRERIDTTIIYTYFISFGIFGIYLILNYKDNTQSIIHYSLFEYLKIEYRNFEYLRNVIIFASASFSPLILLRYKKIRRYFDCDIKYYILFISISALFSFSLMYGLFNSRQIVLNFFYPLILVLILISLIWFFNNYLKSSKIIGVFLLLVLAVHSLVYTNLDSKHYQIPAYFKDKSKLFVASDLRMNATPFAYYVRPYAFQMLDYKYWLPQRIDILNDLNFKNPKEKLEYVHSVSGQSFFKYASKLNYSNETSDLDVIKYTFLKEYGFRYLLVQESEYLNNKLTYLKNVKVKNSLKFDKNVLLLELDLRPELNID